MEEENKEKYIKLQNSLITIKQELEEAQNDYNELKAVVKENILIDDKIAEDEIFTTIEKNIDNTLTEMKTTTMPLINNQL